MIAVVAAIAAVAVVVGFTVELLRWWFRPAARRLRMIKKIGGQRE